ncbi:MAG: hypothetical protein F4107_11250 [Gemmatimonadetes bacterium]|nr:hypothetical protein [Gemmatimonadota bacterium]MYD14059.1 hypothetical protein [Gemmatimonadota bacterium]MYI66487.1 hypothetical protein [Gemmatimonadota bacterium]
MTLMTAKKPFRSPGREAGVPGGARKATLFSGAAAVLLAALLAIPTDATAQARPDGIAGEGFLWGQLAAPLGEFHDNVGLGGGGGLGGLLYLGDQRYAALRAEGSFIIYGAETIRRPLSPTVPFVDVDVETTNSILAAGVGPQIFLSSGPVRPYIYGTVGLSYFVTQTSVKGDHDDEPIASTTNFDDLNLSLSGGGGLAVLVHQGDVSVHLDLSAVYNHNGLAEYLTEGGLRELRGGGWTADPIASNANLVTYRVGITIGPNW